MRLQCARASSAKSAPGPTVEHVQPPAPSPPARSRHPSLEGCGRLLGCAGQAGQGSDRPRAYRHRCRRRSCSRQSPACQRRRPDRASALLALRRTRRADLASAAAAAKESATALPNLRRAPPLRARRTQRVGPAQRSWWSFCHAEQPEKGRQVPSRPTHPSPKLQGRINQGFSMTQAL